MITREDDGLSLVTRPVTAPAPNSPETGGRVIRGERKIPDERVSTVTSTLSDETAVVPSSQRSARSDMSGPILDRLYAIRAGLLDIEDAEGSLDASMASRLADVNAEIAAIRRAEAARLRERDPGWARLEALAAQVLASVDPAGGRSQ